MKQWALSIAVTSFFVLAIVCWLSDLTPMICALRAGAGAVAIYFIVRLGGRLAVGILVDAVLKSSSATARKENGNEGQQ